MRRSLDELGGPDEFLRQRTPRLLFRSPFAAILHRSFFDVAGPK